MAKRLRVLMIEDSEDDALLVLRELTRGGYAVVSERVETAETMAAARIGRDWDLVIADYNLPHFSAPEALELIRRSDPDLPFIVVSGTVGEETAVETMRQGAHDYLLKDSLTRLVPAVERELHEAAIRQERRKAQHALGERVKELQCLYGIATVTQRADVTQDEVFQEVVNLIPPGWHYPDITCARVMVDGKEFVTPGYRKTDWRQASDILVDHKRVGVVEVYYLEEKPELDEGPFLKEERNLMDGIAGQLAGFVQRRRADDLKEHLSAMLRAIRNVNQLIVKEKDPDRLLKRACENFVRSRGCDMAWIALLDSSRNPVKVAGAAADRDAVPLIRRLKEDVVPGCGQRALQRSAVVTTGVSSSHCDGCALAEVCGDKAVMTVRLQHDGQVYGLLSAGLPARFLSEPEERSLFKEVAGDISFALHGMELDKRHEQAEVALLESEGKYHAIFSEARDGIALIDGETGMITDCNAEFERQTGRDITELQSMHIWELSPPDQTEMASSVFLEGREKGGLGSTEMLLVRPQGDRIPVEFTARAVEIAGRQYMQSISRDITERKTMEEQLIVTDRLATIGELASGIAHELNNPLTSVIGFSELVMRKEVPEEAREYLEIINREAKRTSGIVRNLLTFARKQAPTKEPVDVQSVLQVILDLRAYEEKVSNVEVSTRFAPDLPEIMADGSQLQQVFLNVVLNAEQAMLDASGRGTLTITTERSGNAIRVSFADDGPGISEDDLGHIFDPFFTTKDVGKGTGLGLSICYGIVTEHGGKMYAESEVGKGTTFTVELPIGGASDGAEETT